MTNDLKLQFLCQNLECEYTADAPLKDYTTFRIGGPADCLIEPYDEGQVAKVVEFCQKSGIRYQFLGNGSNVLAPDGGVRGAVIRLGPNFSYIRRLSGGEILCGAGATLAQLASFAQKQGLTGLEFAWGIPGSVGGALYMNAGAYGGEMKDAVVSADIVDEAGRTRNVPAAEMELGYRTSVFQHRNWCITRVHLRLREGDPEQIRRCMEDYMERRREKQPLEYPSAGSVFKRPEGNYAGALIEQCGLKGRRVGGAQVSEKHAGFIVNTGGATCRDVLELIGQIQREVADQTGYQLICEVRQL
ncbi:MAG: UDP-N-acetylmuramate dehydrogenase [Oscillospiraceae bacterium]|nr:UDP-N-acetylmuramate dehydrogenase [Oscillospiraceae bacterium]